MQDSLSTDKGNITKYLVGFETKFQVIMDAHNSNIVAIAHSHEAFQQVHTSPIFSLVEHFDMVLLWRRKTVHNISNTFAGSEELTSSSRSNSGHDPAPELHLEELQLFVGYHIP